MLVNSACWDIFIKMAFDSRLAEQFEEASIHLWELLEGRDKAVAGTTCKYLFLMVFAIEVLWGVVSKMWFQCHLKVSFTVSSTL